MALFGKLFLLGSSCIYIKTLIEVQLSDIINTINILASF